MLKGNNEIFKKGKLARSVLGPFERVSEYGY
jgi:hypothetical protein